MTHVLLGVLSVRHGLAARILAIDEQFDGAVLVCLHLLHHGFVESVHVELVEHNCRNDRLVSQVKLDILLQVVERVLIALDQDQVKAFLRQVVGIDAARLSACSVYHGRVSGFARA